LRRSVYGHLMSDNLQEGLKEEMDFVSKQVAEEVKEEYLGLLAEEDQGADGLADYVTVVDQSVFGGEGYAIRVIHPYAPLHEKGGHIEPTYGRAAALGWSRDEMYEALTDCNEFVDRKGTLAKAADQVKSDNR